MTPARLRGTLAAACVAQFMILLDISIVNIALPAIQQELVGDTGNLIWVVNAYVVVLASLILICGGLGDRFGRKRWFVTGFALFTIFSAGCALSTNEHELIVFRALQGVGAALLAPLALSILVEAFPRDRRTAAIGVWAGIAGVGMGLGPVLGGVLISAFDWSAVFWVNVPIGLVGIGLTLAYVRESRDPTARRLDVFGAVLASAGLFCLTLMLIESDDHAWTSAFTLTLAAAAVILLGLFVWHVRRAAEPLVPPAFFRRPGFTPSNATFALMYGAFSAVLFLVTLWMQNVKGYSALDAGLLWLWMVVPFLVVAPIAGKLVARMGARRCVLAGTLVGGLGMLGLALLGTGTAGFAVVPSLIGIGLAFGLAIPAASTTAMGAVEPEHGGVAAGVLNSSRQVGSAIGLAALGALNAAVAANRWDDYVATLSGSAKQQADALVHSVSGGQSDVVAAALGPAAGSAANSAFVAGLDAAMIAAGAMVFAAFAITLRFAPRQSEKVDLGSRVEVGKEARA